MRKGKTMENTINLAELIDIDYHVFGITCTALVTNEWGGSPWYAHVKLIGYGECDSDWHEENVCECVSEDAIREYAHDMFTHQGYILVTDDEE